MNKSHKMKTVPKSRVLEQFTHLTWGDLKGWAGDKIMSRGRSYQKDGHVTGLSVTPENKLIAWVQGTELYATLVTIDPDGILTSFCTCPYEMECKHAVAVVLEYLEAIKRKENIPLISEDDERLHLIFDETEDDSFDFDEGVGLSDQDMKEIKTILNGKSKSQLITMILDAAEDHPGIVSELMVQREIDTVDVTRVVARLKKEIKQIGRQPGWQDYWNHEGYTPDYSNVRKKLKYLLDRGHADEVLELGDQLIKTGTHQVEMSDDDGETAMEISLCMPCIIDALNQSSKSIPDRLLWAVDVSMNDSYGLFDSAAQFLHGEFGQKDWHIVADRLTEKLQNNKFVKSDDFSRKYARDRLSDWLIHALDHAGRRQESLQICRQEAVLTDSYERLTKRLMDEKEYEEAEQWIRKGIQDTKEKYSGIANALQKQLSDIYIKRKNWPTAVALHVHEFINYPSAENYAACEKISLKINGWPVIQNSLMTYLETGTLPWLHKDWPLPDTGLDIPAYHEKRVFPNHNTLIDIAILEKKADQVLHWYDQAIKKPYYRFDRYDDRIADAVQAYAPDRAVGIWKNIAESLIGQAKPKAYQEAMRYLKKVKKMLAGQKRADEWNRTIQELREKHKRKIRLMECLDVLENKPIAGG